MKINCDLGENESAARGRALLAWVDLANIACGGHAGSLRVMERYVKWCRQLGVMIGAHPGVWSREDQGRDQVRITPENFELLLVQQVSALEKVARHHGVSLYHLKLHGALYHASEAEAALANAYVRAVSKWWPKLKVIAFAGGAVARRARHAGLRVWEEAFVDRAYQADGRLVSRQAPNALLSVKEAVAQARGLIEHGMVRTSSGQLLITQADTLCVHNDTPGALQIARRLQSNILRSL